MKDSLILVYTTTSEISAFYLNDTFGSETFGKHVKSDGSTSVRV